MMRHTLGSKKKYLWVENKKLSGEKLEDAAKAAMLRREQDDTVRLNRIATAIAKDCEVDLVRLCSKEQIRGPAPASTPNMTRQQQKKAAVVNAPTPEARLQALKSHSPLDQRRIIDDLAKDFQKKDELQVIVDRLGNDEPSAVEIIKMLLKESDEESPKELINTIVSRSTVQQSEDIFPRTHSYANASDQNKKNALRIFGALVSKCTKLLLPKEGPDG